MFLSSRETRDPYLGYKKNLNKKYWFIIEKFGFENFDLVFFSHIMDLLRFYIVIYNVKP